MNERILIVDDEPDVLRLCSRVLQSSDRGYTVVEAADSEQARRFLQSQEFDLLILDLHLPGESGISLLKHVREVQPGLRAMLITGHADAGSVIDSIRLNVRQYLCKPFTVGKLLEAVRASLQEGDS